MNKSLKLKLLVSKITRQQHSISDALPSLVTELKRILRAARESDDRAEELTNLTSGTLEDYSPRLQAVTEESLREPLEQLVNALRTARRFQAAVPKLKAEKFLRFWNFEPSDDDDAETIASDFQVDPELAGDDDLDDDDLDLALE